MMASGQDNAMERTNLISRKLQPIFVALIAVSLLLPTTLSVTAQTDDGTATGSATEDNTVGQVEIRVESTGAVTSGSLVNDLEPVLADIQEMTTVVVGSRPDEALVIRFVASANRPTDAAWTAISQDTWVNDDATVAIVDLDAWLALPEIEAENRFRHLIARRWLVDASGGALPPALVDGFARYLETPVLAQQARLASIVQQGYLDGGLPSWSEMVTAGEAQPAELDEAVASRQVALAAFLVERYGTNVIGDLATWYADTSSADPARAITDVTGQTPDRLDASWNEFLGTWFGGGWRSNLFAALDLQPAENLFARGAYEAAVDRANQTLLLTTALDDRVGSAEAERVAAQGSVGMQAEALMADAEEALRDHEYARAAVLIDRAEDQYALLPEDHRPASLVDSWRNLATNGIDAIAQTEQAHADSADWFSMHAARDEAIEAGSAFAALGDTDRVAGAQGLVDELDARLFRLVLALGGAAVLLVGWLLVWGWNRTPARVHWPTTLDRTRREVAA